jgi:membrane protease YdiL (CAAX protease family)
VHLTLVPLDFYLILLFLGTIVPWRGAVRIKRLLAKPTLAAGERLSLYRTTILYQWLLVAVVAWRAFGRNLTRDELGLTVSDPWRVTLISLLLTLLLCANQWASLRRIMHAPEMRSRLLFKIAEKIAPRTSIDLVAFAALSCTAGLCEEFLYRGFVFAVFTRTLANSTFPMAGAAVLSSALFAIGHVYQGKRGLITTFVVGLIFSIVRIWSGSLLPSVVAHGGIDLIAGLLVSRSIKSGEMVDANESKT